MGIIAPTHTRTYRRLVEGTTINGTTLLSTDYLNHFNEIVMMLELAVDMPDVLDEMDDWHPKSYARHFEDSGLSHKDLAVAAYEHAPAEFRAPFDQTIAAIETMITTALPNTHDLLSGSDAEAARHHVLSMTRDLRALIERASAIVNGERIADDPVGAGSAHEKVMEQDDIDALFA